MESDPKVVCYWDGLLLALFIMALYPVGWRVSWCFHMFSVRSILEDKMAKQKRCKWVWWTSLNVNCCGNMLGIGTISEVTGKAPSSWFSSPILLVEPWSWGKVPVCSHWYGKPTRNVDNFAKKPSDLHIYVNVGLPQGKWQVFDHSSAIFPTRIPTFDFDALDGKHPKSNFLNFLNEKQTV